MAELKDLKTWAEINEAIIAACDSNDVHQFQKMQLATFIQIMEDYDLPIKWNMYAATPRIVTFDMISEKPDQFVVLNVTFIVDGQTVFTVSDFCKRKLFGGLFGFLKLPQFKKQFGYYEYANTEATHDVLSNFVELYDDVKSSPRFDNFIKHCNKALNKVAKNKPPTGSNK